MIIVFLLLYSMGAVGTAMYFAEMDSEAGHSIVFDKEDYIGIPIALALVWPVFLLTVIYKR